LHASFNASAASLAAEAADSWAAAASSAATSAAVWSSSMRVAGVPALLAQRHYFCHQRGALRGEGVSVGLPGGCGGGKARLNNLEVRIRGLGC